MKEHDDDLHACHAILDRFDVPRQRDPQTAIPLTLRERMEMIESLRFARKPSPGKSAAEIDALAPVPFLGFRAYGLEFRGLLGDVIRSVRVDPIATGYHVRLVIEASCVNTGVVRDVIAEADVVEVHCGETVEGATLTPEQTIIAHIIHALIEHELDEDLRIDGVPLVRPQRINARHPLSHEDGGT